MKKENVIKVRDTFKNAGVKIQVFGDNSNVYDERYDVFIWDDANELLYIIQRAKTQSVFEYSKPEDAVWYSILEYEIIQYIQSVSDYREFTEILPKFEGNIDDTRREQIKDWVSAVVGKRINAKPGTTPLQELALNDPKKFDVIYGAGAAENYKAEAEGKVVKFTAASGTLQSVVDSAESDSIIKIDTPIASEELSIPEGKKVVLDLNGFEFNATKGNGIDVKGELVIKSVGSDKGSVVINKPISAIGENAKVTIQSGTITTEDNCCILLTEGGSVEINGGNLRANGAPIQSNNTTGNMNATITGGILTSGEGPAIYMPSQGHLKITGGIINGGVSLRMGQVDISGGTFNSIQKNIDNPAEYYSYNGNAWFPDTLYVMGGTYKSEDAEFGNSLKLNITGGTFNCLNDQGSCVAIYDLGKVKQDIEVNISSSVKFTKQVTPNNRKPVDVLTLPDIGVDKPKSGYDNPKFTGKVVVNNI